MNIGVLWAVGAMIGHAVAISPAMPRMLAMIRDAPKMVQSRKNNRINKTISLCYSISDLRQMPNLW